MATTMGASAVALPVAGIRSSSSSLVTVRAAKLSRQAASPGGPIRCNASGNGEQQCAEAAKKGAPFGLSAFMVPILAAAVVGGVQPAVQASELDKFLAPVDFAETSSTDEPYKELLEKMKERRAAREKKFPPVRAEEKTSVQEPKPFSSFFSPALEEKKSPPVQAEEKTSVQEPSPFSSFFSPAQEEKRSPPVQAEEKTSVQEPSPFSSFFSPAQEEKKSSPLQAEEKTTVEAEEKTGFQFPNPFSSFFSPTQEEKTSFQVPNPFSSFFSPAPEEKTSDEESNPFSSFFSPAPAAPQAPQAPPPAAKAPAPAPVVARPSPAEEVVAPVVAAENQKTHGFLPLFLAQFIYLVAIVGGGYVLITTPDSKWRDVQKTVDVYVSKVTLVVESTWTKAKPLAAQAQQKTSQFAGAAKPYVIKAWEVSQPLAVKAFEASKPILKGAQTKAAELFEQARSSKQ